MKLFTLVGLFAFFAANHLGAIDLAGTLPGDVIVDNQGSANYSIPIKVIPGTGGLEPSLQFLYSSRGGNGTMGLGWSVAGLSQITRTGRNLFFDGESAPVTATLESGKLQDRFHLDGQRLIDVLIDENSRDSYWKNGDVNTYRTAVESFSRITANGVAGAGPNVTRLRQIWGEIRGI